MRLLIWAMAAIFASSTAWAGPDLARASRAAELNAFVSGDVSADGDRLAKKKKKKKRKRKRKKKKKKKKPEEKAEEKAAEETSTEEKAPDEVRDDGESAKSGDDEGTEAKPAKKADGQAQGDRGGADDKDSKKPLADDENAKKKPETKAKKGEKKEEKKKKKLPPEEELDPGIMARYIGLYPADGIEEEVAFWPFFVGGIFTPIAGQVWMPMLFNDGSPDDFGWSALLIWFLHLLPHACLGAFPLLAPFLILAPVLGVPFIAIALLALVAVFSIVPFIGTGIGLLLAAFSIATLVAIDALYTIVVVLLAVLSPTVINAVGLATNAFYLLPMSLVNHYDYKLKLTNLKRGKGGKKGKKGKRERKKASLPPDPRGVAMAY